MSESDAPPALAPSVVPHAAAEPSIGRPRTRVQRMLGRWPFALFVLAVGLWMFRGRGEPGPELAEGAAAPELRAPWTEDAAPFDLAAQRGRVVVLAFWATWCPACRAEGPTLTRVHERLGASGDRVVGVSIDTPPLDAIAAAARDYGMRYPIAKATRGDAARFGLELLPTIVVVGPDGTIVQAFEGTASEGAILAAVERARGR